MKFSKNKFRRVDESFIGSSQNVSDGVSRTAQNTFEEILGDNQIEGNLVGIFNIENGSACIMADLNITCSCDPYGPDKCDECSQRISTVPASGCAEAVLYELVHREFKLPIGALGIFDTAITDSILKHLMDGLKADIRKPDRLFLDYKLFANLHEIEFFRFDLLAIDEEIIFADSNAEWDKKTAILKIKALPGQYELFTIFPNSQATGPIGFIALASDLSDIITESCLSPHDPELDYQRKYLSLISESIISSDLEWTYVVNSIIAFYRSDYLSQLSWRICGVLDGHENAILDAQEDGFIFDDEAHPVSEKRWIARALIERGRLSAAIEIYESIIEVSPQDDQSEELERQAALNDYIFKCLIPLKKYVKARDLARAALEETSVQTIEKVNTMSNIAMLAYLLGDFKSCIEHAQSVLKIMEDPDYAFSSELDLTGEANYWKGKAQLMLGADREGKQSLIASTESKSLRYAWLAKQELNALI